MKIKTDFVTNSSSSAFIVVWPNEVKTLEDVSEYIINPAHARIIFRDIKGGVAKKVDVENVPLLREVCSEMEGGHVYGVSADYTDYRNKFAKAHNITSSEIHKYRKWSAQFWEAYKQENRNRVTNAAIKFLEQHGGQHVYFFNYADEDGGIFAELEHQNDWGGLPHIRVSQH